MSEYWPLHEIEPMMHQIRSREFASNARSQVHSTPETCHFGLRNECGLNQQTARCTGRPRPIGFWKAWEDKRTMPQKNARAISLRRITRDRSLALAWLSLVELHPCRAQLRFTRQIHDNSQSTDGYRPNPIPGSRSHRRTITTNDLKPTLVSTITSN